MNITNYCSRPLTRRLSRALVATSHTGKVEKAKTENVTLIPHWPCQHCKAGILWLIGVFKLDVTTIKVERTS